MSTYIIFFLIAFTFIMTCIALGFGIKAYVRATSIVIPPNTITSPTVLPSNLVYTDQVQTLSVKTLVNSNALALIVNESAPDPTLLTVNETNGSPFFEVVRTGGVGSVGIFHLRSLHVGRPTPTFVTTGPVTSIDGMFLTDMSGLITCTGNAGAFTATLRFGTVYNGQVNSVVISPFVDSSVPDTLLLNSVLSAFDIGGFTISGTFTGNQAGAWTYFVIAY